ncbi:MAG TPA: hypothetical protein VN643_04410 [Pyrinomonadaceae bacterium]|nr:hypothetical protein [Pyrinomonadaceae bacterium]
MGVKGQPDKGREESASTPALRGALKQSNKMFADRSSQDVGTNATTSRTNSPSAPAVMTGGRPGESTGERVFKQSLKSKSVKSANRR